MSCQLYLVCLLSDGSPRLELHEMLLPDALKEPWTNLENPLHLNAYYIELYPDPKDRTYKKFGLFVKAPLPVEAERMELDLHLARGRSVMTKFVPSGVAEFDKDEVDLVFFGEKFMMLNFIFLYSTNFFFLQIILAQNFQEMYLKVILDRSEFIPEYVPLGKNEICISSSSTFYLLLPVILHDSDNTITVDWKIVIRCLSSPVFRTPEDTMVEKSSVDFRLQLANGCRTICDVENSLVYAAHNKVFYFITDIIHRKNGYSPCDGSETTSYMEHYERFASHCLTQLIIYTYMPF